MSASTAAGLVLPVLGTGLGGLVLLAVRRPSARMLEALAGLTAGIMLAAAVFSLLVPALELGSLSGVLAGLAAGTAFVLVLDAVCPTSTPASPSARARAVATGRCSC